jgi:pyroglutamyl-peptidase
VKQLHNTILYTESPTEPITSHDHNILVEPRRETRKRLVHITTLKIPVTYEAVLTTVPGLHAHPPRFPPPTEETLPPAPSLPKQGYDFIFHLGVAGRGPLRMERLGHKFGYHMKDAAHKLAPIVLPAEFSGKGMVEPSEAERQERERLAASTNAMEIAGDSLTPTRGFGEGYREFAEEMYTDIDVEKLVHELKRSGIEVR